MLTAYPQERKANAYTRQRFGRSALVMGKGCRIDGVPNVQGDDRIQCWMLAKVLNATDGVGCYRRCWMLPTTLDAIEGVEYHRWNWVARELEICGSAGGGLANDMSDKTDRWLCEYRSALRVAPYRVVSEFGPGRC